MDFTESNAGPNCPPPTAALLFSAAPQPPMSEPSPNLELMRSLGRLVRGLSALFWGLPAALVVSFHTAKAEVLRSFGPWPPIVCTGLLVFGLWQLSAFQKQERIWRAALDRAMLFALLNFGLSPFLYWWNKLPGQKFFYVMVLAMVVSGVLFLASLNLVLRRLGAMLPDETLRLETRQFSGLNLNLLGATGVVSGAYFALHYYQALPAYFAPFMLVVDTGSLLTLLMLPALAVTMALLWKTKEVILESVFGSKPPTH